MTDLLVQGALNGSRRQNEWAAIPCSVAELMAPAIDCVGAGADSFHIHPRNEEGAETLEPETINAVVANVQIAAGRPVGVSTGAWIEPDLDRRVALIGGWSAPDYASVNISGDGSARMMTALLERTIGIEAGIFCVADVETLARSGLSDRLMRVLIEVGETEAGSDSDLALAEVAAIHAALDRAGITAPRLQHGDGAVTWAVLADARRRGLATRIGFEDTLVLPDGSAARDNAALVLAAARYLPGFC